MDRRDDAPAGPVPAPRRPRAVPGPPGDGPSRVPDLAALLEEIGALRTTLQTDLTLAAAALEAGADELAGELVDSDLASVRTFASRATGHLDALASADRPEQAPVAPAAPVAAVAATAPRRRRRLVLSAGPLVAAAAAVLGFVVGVVPEQQPVSTPETRLTSAAMASWQLSRLADAGAPDEELAAAAEQLNDELAALIARAADDPAAAQQALLLLDATEDVLSRQGGRGLLAGVLAEAQQLRARLQEALPAVVARRPVVRPPAPDPVVQLPALVAPRGESQAPAAEPTAEPAAQPAAEPTAEPAPSSAPSPQPPAEPEPQPQPTPEPSGPPSEPDGGPLVPGQDSPFGL